MDERSEIAACYRGVPQNDVGMRTDVLDACAKVRGMEMMLRSMNPEVLAVDEIGSREDLQAIESVINCGCRLLATAHGDSVEKLELRPALQKMVERKVFERYVILDRRKKIGHVEAILNADRDYLYQNDRCHLCDDGMRGNGTGCREILSEAH